MPWLLLLLALLVAPHTTADCDRGALDAPYCDANGDLVADPPGEGDRTLSPRALVFAYTPVEDPSVYREAWSDFLDHLSRVTGLRVTFFPVQSNAAQIEAMRSGRLHVAGFNTGSTPLAVNCAGFVPFTMMAKADGSFGYEMEIITWRDSGIEAIPDLKGKTVAFTSPTSNSGFKAPSAMLAAEFNLIAGRDYETTFSGKHDNTILGVVNKDYAAGAIANSVKIRMIARDVIKESDISVIYRSATFPTTAYGHVYNLEPGLAAKVREAFATFKWEGSGLAEEFRNSGEAQFIPIDYKGYWRVIREIDTANQVSYSCR